MSAAWFSWLIVHTSDDRSFRLIALNILFSLYIRSKWVDVDFINENQILAEWVEQRSNETKNRCKINSKTKMRIEEANSMSKYE